MCSTDSLKEYSRCSCRAPLRTGAVGQEARFPEDGDGAHGLEQVQHALQVAFGDALPHAAEVLQSDCWGCRRALIGARLNVWQKR
jgi:hypothetical protein